MFSRTDRTSKGAKGTSRDLPSAAHDIKGRPAAKLRAFGVRAAVFLFFIAGPICMHMHAQATSTATRAFSIQVGAAYVYDSPDYTPEKWTGGGIYATIDFREHLGVDIEFRQAGHSYPHPPNTQINPSQYDFTVNAYQRDYEIGPRYVRHYGRLNPYAKILYGRGVQNFPEAVSAGSNGSYDNANLGYNMAVIGGGVDIGILRHINARADYEYQRWFSFPSAAVGDSLSPQLFTLGAAYHF